MHVVNDTLLIRNGIVVTMDPALGLLPSGTVVIRGDRLLEVTSDTTVTERYRGAVGIDASGCAVMPGLVTATPTCARCVR